MELYTLYETGVIDDETFEEVVQVGPAPDLATAIMWEKSALNDCQYVTVREATEEEARAHNQ